MTGGTWRQLAGLSGGAVAGGQAGEARISAPEASTAATSVTYAGTPASVPAARRLLRDILAGSPRAGDLELIAAELITNAIRHTPSGHDGGTFTITIRSGPGCARIEVDDLGSGQWPALSCDAFAEYGRGLTLVRALADDAGHGAASGRRHRTWAEVTW